MNFAVQIFSHLPKSTPFASHHSNYRPANSIALFKSPISNFSRISYSWSNGVFMSTTNHQTVEKNKLMEQLGRFGKIEEMMETFQSLYYGGGKPDAHSFTTVINHLGRVGNLPAMVKMFKEMKSEGVKPSTHTYVCMVKYFGSHGDESTVDMIVNMIGADLTFDWNIISFSTIISAYAKVGNFDKSWKYYNRFLKSNIPIDNEMIISLIDICLHNNQIEKLVQVLQHTPDANDPILCFRFSQTLIAVGKPFLAVDVCNGVFLKLFFFESMPLTKSRCNKSFLHKSHSA